MRARSVHRIPEALWRHNEEQRRDPEDVVSNLGRRVRVVVLWRQRDDDPEQWIYLERMLPHVFSYETVKVRWGGGAYCIRLFGGWDPARRQEKYITQVAFWIHRGFRRRRRSGRGCSGGGRRLKESKGADGVVGGWYTCPGHDHGAC